MSFFLATAATVAQSVTPPNINSYNSFEFNGTTQYVSVAQDSSIQFGGTASITLAAWIWVDSAGDGDYRTVMRQDGGYYIRLTNANKLFWKAYASSDLTSSADVPKDQWVHIVCTYDGANLKYYENGVLKDTQAATGNMPSVTRGVAVGRTSGTNFDLDFWLGSISQPMIFTSVLDLSDSETLYNSGIALPYVDIPTSITDDCVLSFEMSSNDNTLTDESTESNDGTANASITSDGELLNWQG